METVTFSDLEISAIGEIINISLGASATAVSNMLDAKVDITTPKVSVLPTSEFDFSIIDPAVCTEISYRVGLDGKNGLLLKVDDVRIIVEMLMHSEIPQEDFELSDLYMSAICEVMNQMMGASATALSEFLGRTVDISTPTAYMIEDPEAFKESYFNGDTEIVSVSFNLKIGDRLESEFINIMRIPLAKELIKALIPDASEDYSSAPEVVDTPSVPVSEPVEEESSGSGKMLSQAEIEALMNGFGGGEETSEPAVIQEEAVVPQPMVQSEPEVAATVSQPTVMQGMDSSAMPTMPSMGMNADAQYMQMQQMMIQMQQMMAQMQGAGNGQMMNNNTGGGRMVSVQPIPSKFSGTVSKGEEQMENKELVMGVPLELSVEIGRTRKTVREILELTKGSLVVLDKLAGEQVDLFVNGQCIAKGDVVVVEDNFGIRVTEIVNKNEVRL